MSDAPPNPPPASGDDAKTEKPWGAAKSTAPAVLPPPVKPVPPVAAGRDSLARGLGVLALGVALGALAYPLLRPAPQLPAAAPAVASETVRELRQQIDGLSETVATLKAAPPPAPVTQMPTPAPAVDNGLADQLHNALTEIGTLRDKLANLQQGVAGAEEVKQQLTQLKNDLAVANTAIASMRGHVQQMTDSAQQVAAAESATRAHVIAYLELRSAAAGAAPFVNELQALCAAAKTNAAVAAECAKLESPSHAGVATLPMLQSRFGVMAAPAERAVAMAEAKTWTDRLKVSFDEVVHIRKIDDTGATETPKLMHDATAALQRGNLPEAVAKVEAMPALAQKELQEWLNDARARVALDSALVRIGAALGQVQPVAVPKTDTATPAMEDTQP